MAKPRAKRQTRQTRAKRSVRDRRVTARQLAPGLETLASDDDNEMSTPGLPRSDGFPIVAVGASAGGLEAFTQVLEALRSAPDLAIVFVQHLSPQHASNLTELLAARTPLKVVTVTNRMAFEPGRIYVMPPNVHMDVVDGQLHLLPRPTDRSQFTPIDHFMQSLARWAQDRTIGVILSGTASDGAAGVREIKAHGGITVVQDPETTKYDGMARAAIATGMVDLVLSPAEIGSRLSQVRRHPYLQRRSADGTTADVSINEQQLRELFLALRRASGIDFKQYKMPTVKRRLMRRMALVRLTTLATYLRYVADTPSEAKALAQDLLIHVTRFFRDPESFDVIVGHVLAELLQARGDDPIRIWVPGCATGEEAYSLGICLLEALGDRAAERRIQIFATDVSDAAVDQARAGVYPVSIAADVSPERLKRFFLKSDAGYRVIKPLRDMCVFARHDLTHDPPFSRLDFILCRNVLIYLDVPLQKRLIAVFHYALKARGFLMLGPAETAGPQMPFAVVDKKWRLFRKLSTELALPLALPSDLRPGSHAAVPAARTALPADVRSVQDEATRLILDRYGPPGVVVDANEQIVQFRGHTGPYLEASSGDPNLNVLKMARGGLLHPLRTALQLARQRARPVRKDHVTVQRNGAWTEIRLDVVPLSTSRGEHFLVLFNESNEPKRSKRGDNTGRRTARARTADSQLSELRRELAASREYLQSIIQELEAANEELQSANEEILSSNEELQSTNEELDTAKEELQSTNEELNTVNEELHSRNDELTRVNSDLTNLLASVDIPIVIVGNDLGIRRFTPRAEQLFNLISGDVGRPIGQINPNFACDDLARLIRETVDAVAPREREVQDRNGRWLSLRVRPYKSLDNRLDGAVLSVIDVDAAKRYQAFVEESRDHFRAIVGVIHQPLLVVDGRGRVFSANAHFRDRYGRNGADIEGHDIATLNAAFNGRPIAAVVERVLRDGQAVDEQWPEDRASGRTIRVRGNRIPLGVGEQGVLIAIEDQSDGHGQA